MTTVEVASSIVLGVALAAAVGLRVFLPLLIASIAAHSGNLAVSDTFAWLGTYPAMIMLAVAAAAEVAAYYIPVVDNVLDAIATPTAFVAGSVMAAAVMVDLPPLMKWATAIIAGGGAAGTVQWTTNLLRAKSTALTGGVANPLLATAEAGGAATLSLLALLAPLLALALLVVAGLVAVRLLRRLLARRS